MRIINDNYIWGYNILIIVSPGKTIILSGTGSIMRVITGKAKGRRLQTLPGEDVRPTTDTVKEAVFSIIQFSVEGAAFLDAFAGSGQMGIEALSRGAEKAVFVDNSRNSLRTVRENIKVCSLEQGAKVVASDTISYMSSTGERFDIIFLDPPYQKGLLQRALEKAPALMRSGGMIICEHPAEEKLPENAGGFTVYKEYRYGRIMISIYKEKDREGI